MHYPLMNFDFFGVGGCHMERPFKLHKRLVTTTLLKVRPALATCLPFKKYRLRVTDPSTDPYCVTLGRKKKQTKDGEKMQTTKQLVVFFFGGGGHPILPPKKKANQLHEADCKKVGTSGWLR